MLPTFSIVIPNLNGAKYLEEAILSIIEQNYPNFEIIIVDGGSTDESIDIIKEYNTHIGHWLSEPDNGQADAINKGLALATGDYFDWLNSDDKIAPDTFWKVAREFEQHPTAYAVCGYMTYFSGKVYEKPVRMTIFESLEKTMIFGSMSVPSMYFRLDKIRALGPLEVGLHFCFDMELWYRFIEKYGIERLQLVDGNFCYFRLHPISKTVSQLIKFGEEQFLVHRSVVQSFSQKNLPIIPHEKLGVAASYMRYWDIKEIVPIVFTAYSIQRQLELLHSRLAFIQIIKWFFISILLYPKARGWRFYLLPFRAVRWKVLMKLN